MTQVPGNLHDFAIGKLSHVTPTSMIHAWRCGMNGYLVAANCQPLLPPHPEAFLGTVVHKCVSAILEKETNTGVVTVESEFDLAVESMECQLLANWITAPLVPLWRCIPMYFVRRRQACQMMSKHGRIQPRSHSKMFHSLHHPALGTEINVCTKDAFMKGRIDYVFRDEKCAALVIRELKSGFPNTAKRSAEPYWGDGEVQLRLYAGLYEACFAKWADRLELVTVTGCIRPVMYTPGISRGLLEDARAWFNSTNERISSSCSIYDNAVQDMAVPSAPACKRCLYRPACSSYHERSSTTERGRNGWPTDVIGTLLEKYSLENGRLSFLIQPLLKRHDQLTVRGISPSTRRHPVLASLVPGQRIGLFNVSGELHNNFFQESNNTTIYLLRGKGL